MTLGTILLIVLILFLVGALPTWGHSRNWGYGPSGGLGLVLVIVLILLVLGKILRARVRRRLCTMTARGRLPAARSKRHGQSRSPGSPAGA